MEVRECTEAIQLRGIPTLKGSSRQCNKEVNTGHENEEIHLSEENEPVSTWTRCVQGMAK